MKRHNVFNIKKTLQIDIKGMYGNNKISHVSLTKFLGLVVDNMLWSTRIEGIVNKLHSVIAICLYVLNHICQTHL